MDNFVWTDAFRNIECICEKIEASNFSFLGVCVGSGGGGGGA